MTAYLSPQSLQRNAVIVPIILSTSLTTLPHDAKRFGSLTASFNEQKLNK
jgi:hypothetical protein